MVKYLLRPCQDVSPMVLVSYRLGNGVNIHLDIFTNKNEKKINADFALMHNKKKGYETEGGDIATLK